VPASRPLLDRRARHATLLAASLGFAGVQPDVFVVKA